MEAQGDWADLSNTRVSLLNPLFSTRTKTDGIGLFTGQIGYAWNASLFYVKGGAAVTDNRFSILSTLTGTGLAAASATRWGGTVGVGWEYGFAPNWSAGIEYDHLFMGNSNNSFSVVNPIAAAFLNDRISQDVDMVTLRINYRFGGFGAPVVSRNTDLFLLRILQQTRPAEMPAFLLEGCLKIRQTGDPTATGSSAGCWGLHRGATGHFPPLASHLAILQRTAGKEPGSCR